MGEESLIVCCERQVMGVLHHSQQDLKNRVSQRRIKVFRLQQSQETRFLALVQDMSLQGAEYRSLPMKETQQMASFAVN